MVELQRMRMGWHGYGEDGGSDLGEEVGEGKEAIKREREKGIFELGGRLYLTL
jgi:hypothetical protein